jgi:dipeptidyl aminopeptidase/acylaminoacyl peptidase
LIPSATPTPDHYAGLTVADLAARSYGESELLVDPFLSIEASFQRARFRYTSDGIEVHGFVDHPTGEGPFPVVLVLHGYIDPERYSTLAYTSRYADALARRGFIVLHPNYRNYPPSEEGPNPFRVGYAVDVLNLVALVRGGAGKTGPLSRAGPGPIGLFGHSMGGGIALRVITVDPQVGAALLYGSMSGDERRNYAKIHEWTEGARGRAEMDTPEEDLRRLSPIYHLERIGAVVSIHHGEVDETVPPAWSEDLCRRLEALRKEVECFVYTGQPHTFSGAGDALLIERAASFFERALGQ